MNVTGNITGIEDLENITNIKLSSILEANYYLHIYIYLIIGPILLLINTFVFVIVMISKILRSTYLKIILKIFKNVVQLTNIIFLTIQISIIISAKISFDQIEKFQKILPDSRIRIFQ